jgi:pSer/pThr/pTyr-binding forkhead associated (FHA) protein
MMPCDAGTTIIQKFGTTVVLPGQAGTMSNLQIPDKRSPHATLTCLSGKYAGRTYHIEGKATIGRSGDNAITLDAMVVSNRHAGIYYDEQHGTFVIEDLGSRTGILIDDIFVDDRAQLLEGQTFTIANEFKFMFHTEDHSQPDSYHNIMDDSGTLPEVNALPSASSDDERIETPIDGSELQEVEIQSASNSESTEVTVQEIEHSGDTISVVYELVKSGIENGRKITLAEGINLIGRDEANTIVLQDTSVSRHHAVIVVDSGRITVRDLDSKNHTFVDGEQVQDERDLKEGSVVLFGMVSFVVRMKH